MEAFSQLLGTVCNEVPFRKIVVELRKAGYHRTLQCRDKVKVLHRQYREIMDKLQRSGDGLESDEVTVADLPWFQEMHHVLKHRAVTTHSTSLTAPPQDPAAGWRERWGKSIKKTTMVAWPQIQPDQGVRTPLLETAAHPHQVTAGVQH